MKIPDPALQDQAMRLRKGGGENFERILKFHAQALSMSVIGINY